MRLTEIDGKFQIDTDDGRQITLSRLELSGIVRQASQFRDQLLVGEGDQPFALMVSRNPEVYVALDAHHTEVVLRVVEVSGTENSYVFSPDEARKIRNDMTKQIEQIERGPRPAILD